MSSFIFNGRKVTLPGAYSVIKSGETNPARTLDYGKVLIIDTGVAGASYGGGAGISGQLASGIDAVYSFQTLEDFRAYMKGGLFWRCSEALFYPDPSNPAAVGISELYFCRACTTTSASMSFATTAGGTFKIFTRDEGLWANAVVEGEDEAANLVSGYGYQIVTGSIDPTKWQMQIYRGTFTGLASDGLPFGDETAGQSTPELMAVSPEFNNIQTLIDWATNDSSFNNYFALDPSSAVEGEGTVDQADITAVAGWQKATGATETYSPTDIDAVLKVIAGLDYNVIFTDQVGASAAGTTYKKIITHINNVSKFNRFLYIGGYESEAQWSDSIKLAQGFDSPWVQLVHGDSGVNTEFSPLGYRWWTVLYTMCAVVGRVSGKPPYIPVTNKTIGVDRLKHQLSDTEKEQAVAAGVLVVTRNDYINKFVVLDGINTLQDNANLFNAKGYSPYIQFMRIIAQLNRELVVNAEIDLLGDENGVNSNTLSANVIKNWTAAYLQSRVANETDDNLILAFQDVNVTKKEDAWFVTYKVRLNSEINKIFFTGFLIR
jgi:hypothetical protein